MRKISKISLVAAVAVAGLSTANAQPLEEAIKNVEVSGSVVYRYDNFHNKDSAPAVRGNGDSGKNNYKVGLNLASKVNDYVKFNSRFLVADGSNGGFVGLGAGRSNTAGGPAGTAGSDANAEVTLSQAYFSLTAIPNTVVNIGKQGLTTPYTVAQDINGNEQNGTGILALTNIDAFTFGAGYFNNTNLDESFELNGQKGAGYGANGSGLVFDPLTGYSSTPATIDGGNDIYVVTAQADLDAVKLEAWYVGMQDTFNTYTLAATSSLELAENANLGLEARYVNLKLKQDAANALAGALNTETKNDMFRLAVDGKFDIVNARLAFTKTGKKGGLTALDQDAKNTSLGWAITSNGAVDAKYWQAALGADILENLNFTVHYGNIKSKDNTTANAVSIENYKAQEVFGQLTYKMSKNLSTYLRYGTYKEKVYSTGAKAQDQNRGRIQVAYTF